MITFEDYLHAAPYEKLTEAHLTYAEACQVIGPLAARTTIAIDGPTNSGKSTLSKALIQYCDTQEMPISVLPLDLFLTDRSSRTTIQQSIVDGLMPISAYSAAAWDQVAYTDYVNKAQTIIRDSNEPELLRIDATYNRQTGKRELDKTIPVFPNGILLLEGVGIHMYHADAIDLEVYIDVVDTELLTTRMLQREEVKPVYERLPRQYLLDRFHSIDEPHAEYLRASTAGKADIVLDSSDSTGVLLYKKIEE